MMMMAPPSRSLAQRMISITAAVSSGERPAQGSSSSSTRGSVEQRHRELEDLLLAVRQLAPPCARRRRGTDSAIAAPSSIGLVQRRRRGSSKASLPARPLHSAMARLSAIDRAGKDARNLQLAARRPGADAMRRQAGEVVRPPRPIAACAAPSSPLTHVEHRGLAGAVRADHAEDPGSLEIERQPVEDGDLADVHARRRRARASPAAARPDRRARRCAASLRACAAESGARAVSANPDRPRAERAGR